MQCEDAINLISARIDGELSADDRSLLEAHLSECANCRAMAEAMQLQDAQLVRAFATRRKAAAELADRVTMQLAPPRRSWWVPVTTSAAAGFLLAVLLFRPWEKAAGPSIGMPIAPASVVPIGRLDIATGPVEMRAPGSRQWERMATGAPITFGCSVRTGPNVRCELAMDDGSEVRIDEETELAVRDRRDFDLAGGQVFSCVAKNPQPFRLAAADATVTALVTRFDIRRRSDQVILAVLDGSTRLADGRAAQVVNAGQVVSFADGKITPVEGSSALDQATRWIDDILVLKGRDNPELNRRIDDLFAQIGEGKMIFLREGELKALGDRCVIPLTRYIQSERSANDETKRHEAARIVTDVAQPWCIPYLIQLLDDGDGEVRASAAAGLLRLTGHDLGRSPQQWHDQSREAGHATFVAWQQWWNANKNSYPGAATPEVSSPPSTNSAL